MMYTIKHLLIIKKAPKEVFEALTTKSGLCGWWTIDVDTDDVTKPGSTINFVFGKNFSCDMKVLRQEQNKIVEWQGISDPKAWVGSQFIFDLSEDPLGTKLRFTQIYAENAPLSEDEYGSYTYNWGWYLRSLKDLCETGVGSPFGSESNPSGII